MIPPFVWRAVLIVAVAVLLLVHLLASSPFPSGADPGFMLAMSYSFEGHGPEGALAYPPALPGVMFLVRRLTGGDTSSLFWWVKALGLLCLVVEALGLAAFAGAIAGRSAALWTFALAAWNPNSWNQLLWGGYAQLLAVGLGGCALALFVKGIATPKAVNGYLAASGGVFGAVVLTHAYSAFFFATAALALSVSRRALLPAVPVAAIAVAVALPAVPAYSHFLGEVTSGRWSLEGYGIGLTEVAQNTAYHPAVSFLMGALLVLAIVAGPRGALSSLSPFSVACVLLFVVTPPIHVARAGLFAWHGAVLFMGISFARATFSPRLRFAVLSVAGLTPLVSFAELATLTHDYAPLRGRDAVAMLDLAEVAEGRTLIVSPTPNLDGWWYEGLTGKPALIGDYLRWSLLREQQERSVDAQTIAHATRVDDGGSMRRLTLELPGLGDRTTLWVEDSEYFPLIDVRSGPFEAVLTPARNVRFRDVVRNADSISLRCEFLYDWFRVKGFTRVVDVDVGAEGAWTETSSKEEIRIHGEKLTLSLGIRGAEVSAWQTQSVDELILKWNVSHVWVRDKPGTAQRFELDPRFERFWSGGEVAMYRVR